VDELGEVFEWAQSQEKIVFICGYPPIGPGLTGGMDLLSRIADALSEFPNTTLVIGHAGVPNLLSASEIARRFPNVYLDLSLLLSRMSTTSLVTDLRWLLETLDTRLLFGSDYPDQDWLAAVDSMNDLEAGLPEAKVKNVWSDNAMRILGLLEHEK
jgi:predicted TIM-barrel fold metal-dependent hydrolase